MFSTMKVQVRVIEFQKRGAPHAHVLMWVENFDPTPNNIDKVTSAKIPDKGTPLREILTNCMMHGLCGSLNSFLSCIKNGQ